MDDPYVRLAAAVEQLQATVRSLEQRVGLLEAQGFALVGPAVDAAAVGAGTTPTQAPAAGFAARHPHDPIVVLSLVGRLLLVLAGGFFLRAMTEAGLLAPPVGIALAFAYGLVWLAMTDRAGRHGQPLRAAFHALAAVMIAFPLLVEATTRFKVLSGASGAVGITLLTAAFLFVAWRQRLQSVAWVAVVAALPTAVVLLLKTDFVAPYALYLIALGVATLWLGHALAWTILRWPVALAADLVVAGVTLRAFAPQHHDELHVAMLLQWSLLGAYLGSIAIRTLLRGRNVTPFEIVQSAAALLVGLGGAVLLTRVTGTLPATIAVVSLLCGVACYVIAFVFVGQREDLERNVHFYATLALVLVLAGLTLILRNPWLGAVLAGLGALAAGGWSRTGRLYFLMHGAAYLVAAAIVSGALGYSAWALAANPAGPWTLPGAVLLVVLGAGALSSGLAAARPAPAGGVVASALRFVILVVCSAAVIGGLIGYLAPIAAGMPGRGVDLGALATARTGVLAAVTLLAAWLGRHTRFREWLWLVYPLLVLTGLKMVAQDFQHSRPATLFMALALYGAALILAPRLRRGGGSAIAQPAQT